MKSWAIGEVARLLGVRTHVIRYWESELPLLSPRKGPTGRRTYTAGDVQLLMKFRHLLYERKFTVEGAKRRLWEELGAGDPDLRARFAAVRANLIDALMLARRTREGPGGERDEMNEREILEQLTAAGQEHLFAYWDERPVPMKRMLLDDLAGLDLALVQELRELLEETGGLHRGAIRLRAAAFARPLRAAERKPR